MHVHTIQYYLNSKGQTLNIKSSDAIVKTMQKMNKKNDGPTVVPVGNLKASPPTSGILNPRGNTRAAKQNAVTERKDNYVMICDEYNQIY